MERPGPALPHPHPLAPPDFDRPAAAAAAAAAPRRAAPRRSFPYAAFIRSVVYDSEYDSKTAYRCTGTVIRADVIMTAAHCLAPLAASDYVEVWAGAHAPRGRACVRGRGGSGRACARVWPPPPARARTDGALLRRGRGRTHGRLPTNAPRHPEQRPLHREM